MADLREAFLKAANQNPGSSLSHDIRNANVRGGNERKIQQTELKAELVRRRFNRVGHDWFDSSQSAIFPISDVHKLYNEWKLDQVLNDADVETRTDLLSQLSQGMHLSPKEETLDELWKNEIDEVNSLSGGLLVKPDDNEPGLSFQSRMFIIAFVDLSPAFKTYDNEIIRRGIELMVSQKYGVDNPIKLYQVISEIASQYKVYSNPKK